MAGLQCWIKFRSAAPFLHRKRKNLVQKGFLDQGWCAYVLGIASFRKMGQPGLEPGTDGLWVRCSNHWAIAPLGAFRICDLWLEDQVFLAEAYCSLEIFSCAWGWNISWDRGVPIFFRYLSFLRDLLTIESCVWKWCIIVIFGCLFAFKFMS